jgi:hypothetical protein
MRKTGVFALAVIVICSVLYGALAQPPEPSLPANLKIESPEAGVSPRLAQLSGIWEGAWEYKPPVLGGGGAGGHRLFPIDVIGYGVKIAIIKISPPNVKAIYARPGKSFQVRGEAVAVDTIVLRWGKPGEKRTLTLIPTANPKVADAKLEIEGKTMVLTAKLRKK